MFESMRRMFTPPAFPGDEERTRLARLLNVILPSLAALCASIPFFSGIAGDFAGLVILLALVLTALYMFLWGMLHRGHTRISQILVPFQNWIAMTLATYLLGGIHSSATSSLVVVIVLAALLLGRRGSWFYTFLSVGSLFGLFFAEQAGLMTFTKPLGGTPFDVFSYIIIFLIVAVLINASINNLEVALGQTRIQEGNLAQANASLQSVLNGLEETVAERTRSVEEARQEIEAQAWLSKGLADLGLVTSGEQDLSTLADKVIRQFCGYLNIPVGAIFVFEGDSLQLQGSYSFSQRKHNLNRFRLGEGLVGQAALEKRTIFLRRVPEDYMPVQTSLAQVTPKLVVAAPFIYQGNLIGVIELGLLQELTEAHDNFLNEALETIAISFHTTRTRRQVDLLLAQTQEQAEALQEREESLRAVNEELQSQAESLRNSQEKLRQQQTELELVNAELEERAATLQQQRTTLDEQNRELKTAQEELKRNAAELTQANKYKSEFLANMSHELRTPLNSLLILSRMLANNESSNLTPDQVESAQIIYNSGNDLLQLINEILDLSKVEAGRMTFHYAPMPLQSLANAMQIQFAHVAEEKGLAFEAILEPGLPPEIETDQQRVEQILKNLLSNAFKFTEQGKVTFQIRPAGGMVALNVIDSGIGMTPEQQKRVFEAFQQADGSTSRKYGGTGLGLTISRELAANLGGRIGLQSELKKGSTFTLYLPLQRNVPEEPQPAVGQATAAETLSKPQGESSAVLPGGQEAVTASVPASLSIRTNPALPDDRECVQKGDKVLLVIEDDVNFAKVVFDYAHRKEFKCLLATNGEDGISVARQLQPDAILLDLKLPGMSGWEVLDTLKREAPLRHIPVHILSASEETIDAYKRGALGFLSKPVDPDGLDNVFQKITDFLSREIRTLLIVEDDTALRLSVRKLLGGSDVKISEAARGQAAMEALRKQHFDCMILDLTLPDMTGFELLNRINQDETVLKCPVIVYTGKALTEEENCELLKYADSVIIKGVKSPERLLDETALFLHRVVADMPEEKQKTIRRLHDRDAVFSGKQVLVVDDDMRNAFALSRLLTDKGLTVSIARSGAKALEVLDTTAEIDLVLMDIMMPEMDGYETMQRIRAQSRFQNLPMLALTAKAMRGDLEKCIAAGANDYLSKPVDAERLFSMLRVWLYR
jgi:CheY-like chemotaxis protein/signal transduction histidine kinase